MKNFIVTISFLCVISFGATINLKRTHTKLRQLEVHEKSADLLNVTKSDAADTLNTLQLIKREGYPAEGHVVLTEDGYILTIHRIPGKPGSPVVFLQHGLLGSSADWVLLGKNKALAYLLADQGYDVWLGNFRGNTYSRAHTSLSDNDLKFWNFSWHEMGVYDLPAMITYVVKLKSSLLKAYIGFSMGSTSFYVMASEKPEIARLSQSVYSLAPIAYLKHVKGLTKYLAEFTPDYMPIFELFGYGEFLPQNLAVKELSRYFCSLFRIEERICANIFFILTGFDTTQFNYALLPTVLKHVPAGTSTKLLVHYAQLVNSGTFRQYDYGKERNMEIYKTAEPPNYNLSRTIEPLTLFVADNDWLSSLIDVSNLIHELPHPPLIYHVPYKKFNHIDYLYAVDAYKLVYKELLAMLNKSKKL